MKKEILINSLTTLTSIPPKTPSYIPLVMDSNFYNMDHAKFNKLKTEVAMVKEHKYEANRLSDKIIIHLFNESSKISDKIGLFQFMSQFESLCMTLAITEKKYSWAIIERMCDNWMSFLELNPDYVPAMSFIEFNPKYIPIMDGEIHRALAIIWEHGVVSCCIDPNNENNHDNKNRIREYMYNIVHC